MLNPGSISRMLMAGMTAIGAGHGLGQSYPVKSIRILTSPPGGGSDFFARLLAQGISGPLGQPVVIDNRPSALVGELGAKATPDGYTLLVASSSVVLGPVMQRLSYDSVKDFSPITFATVAPNLLAVHPSLPARSVRDLIVIAKAKPGVLDYAHGGAGSSSHLAGELFKKMTGTDIVSISYKGTVSALTDLLSGQVPIMYIAPSAAASYIKSGKLRLLAVTSASPSLLFPGIPTVAASIPGYEMATKMGMLAPAGTPPAIISRLNQEMVRALNDTSVKSKLLGVGLEVATSSPEEYRAMIRADVAKIAKLVKDAGIQAE